MLYMLLSKGGLLLFKQIELKNSTLFLWLRFFANVGEQSHFSFLSFLDNKDLWLLISFHVFVWQYISIRAFYILSSPQLLAHIKLLVRF